jgi:hypothetical protein
MTLNDGPSPMTPVTDDALHARWKNNSDCYRSRRRRGLRRLPAVLSRKQLDTLEEKGYLDPGQRGDHEAEAIETFLMDSLCKR